VLYRENAVIKISRTATELFALRKALLASPDRMIRDRASKVALPDVRDGDEMVLNDVNMLLSLVDTIEEWLSSVVRTINMERNQCKDLVGKGALRVLI
jgi:endonuclease YncB( thermonuclease family)